MSQYRPMHRAFESRSVFKTGYRGRIPCGLENSGSVRSDNYPLAGGKFISSFLKSLFKSMKIHFLK